MISNTKQAGTYSYQRMLMKMNETTNLTAATVYLTSITIKPFVIGTDVIKSMLAFKTALINVSND